MTNEAMVSQTVTQETSHRVFLTNLPFFVSGKYKTVLAYSGVSSSQKVSQKGEEFTKKLPSMVGKGFLSSSSPRAGCVTLSRGWCPPVCSAVLCQTPGTNISSKVSFQTEIQIKLLCMAMWMIIYFNQSIIPGFPFRILMEECLIFNTKPFCRSCYKTNSSSGLAQSYTEALPKWFLYKQIHHFLNITF